MSFLGLSPLTWLAGVGLSDGGNNSAAAISNRLSAIRYYQRNRGYILASQRRGRVQKSGAA